MFSALPEVNAANPPTITNRPAIVPLPEKLVSPTYNRRLPLAMASESLTVLSCSKMEAVLPPPALASRLIKPLLVSYVRTWLSWLAPTVASASKVKFPIATLPVPFGSIVMLPFELVELIVLASNFRLSTRKSVTAQLVPSVTASMAPPSMLTESLA